MERPASSRSRRPPSPSPSPLLLLLPLLLLALAGLAKTTAQPVERVSLTAWADADQVHVSQVDPDLDGGRLSQADPDGRVKQTQPTLASWGRAGEGESDHDGVWLGEGKLYRRIPLCRGRLWVSLNPTPSTSDPVSCPADTVQTNSSCGFMACSKVVPGWHGKRLAEQRRAFDKVLDKVLVDPLGVLSHGSYPARHGPHHHHPGHAPAPTPAHSPAPSPVHHHHKAPAPSPVHQHPEHPEHPEQPHEPWHPHPHGGPAKAPVPQHHGDKTCSAKWTLEGNVIEVLDHSKEEPMEGSAREDKAGCKWISIKNDGNWLQLCVKCADVPPVTTRRR